MRTSVERRAWLGLAAAALLVLLAPHIVNDYWLRVFTKVLLFATLASAWNMVAGFCGYPSFGHVAFFGLGAYTAAVGMVRFGIPFVVSLVLGVVLSVVFAVLVGLPVLRLRGHYFAVATLGVAEATKQVVANMSLSGGGEGLSFPLPPWSAATTARVFYYAMALLLVAILVTLWWLGRSRMGYAWRGIRANEDAARVLGVDATFYKVCAWTISAAFTAAAGALYGYLIAFIEPNSIFSANVTVETVVVALLGGSGTILGPVLGAVVFEVLSELVWAQFLEIHGLVLAILFGLIILFMPGGLIKYLRREPARAVSELTAA